MRAVASVLCAATLVHASAPSDASVLQLGDCELYNIAGSSTISTNCEFSELQGQISQFEARLAVLERFSAINPTPRSCKELQQMRSVTLDGSYTIGSVNSSSTNTMQVICDGEWTMVFAAHSGAADIRNVQSAAYGSPASGRTTAFKMSDDMINTLSTGTLR